MGLISAILLGVSLSMDSLSIGISYGLRKIKTSIFSRVIICIISILITGSSILFGNILTMVIPENLAKFIGALMLCLLGLYIILESFIKEKKKDKPKKEKETIFQLALKPFGITINIMRDPYIYDFDKSEHIDTIESIYLGFALSIDSFAAGISSSISGFSSLFIPIFVGLFQILFLSLGDFLGSKVSSFKNIDPKVFVIISGSILIILSIVRYFL